MSQALGGLKTIRAFSASNAVEGLSTHVNAAGNTVFESMPVFKSGTFKDSMGYQATWEPEHLEQMVFNFNMLKDRGIFPNVPVRDGHKSFLGTGGAVIGYITKLTHEQDTGRLLADYEVTEPDAVAKIERGTFRARSAEIGMYETNDEATYWPVFQGFAFVDIPAVEGLYSKAGDNEFVIMTEHTKETRVDPEDTEGTEGTGTQSTPGTEPTSTPPQGEPTTGTAPAEGEPGENPDGSTPAPVVPTTTEHGRAGGGGGSASTVQVGGAGGGGGAFQFSINGTPTNDFASVQRHITALEQAASEQRDTNRRSYVSGLARDNKITQPQVEGLTQVALTMTDEQFTNFCAAYDAAPKQPLLGRHGAPSGSAEHSAPSDAVAEEIATLEETIAMHRRSGVPEAQLSKMPSSIRLAALQSQNPKE